MNHLLRVRAALVWLVRDIKSAAVTMLGAMIVYLVGSTYIAFLLTPARLITGSIWLQACIALVMLFVIGIAIRKIRDIKWAAWLVQFLPTAPLEQQECRFRIGEHYETGILIGYESVSYNGVTEQYAKVATVNAGPTSIGFISVRLIRASAIELTGRTLKDVAKELATLGVAKSNPPHTQ